ncbi:MAG: SLBB domain-containing protein [Verrucomicrobiales bacterium]|nr:SLBB domain-containing protein [Verrucomicrobiales bacterium]
MNLLFKNVRSFAFVLIPLVALVAAAGCGSVPPSSAASPADRVTVAHAASDGAVLKESADIRDGGDVLRVGDPISIRFSGVTVADPPASVEERLKSDGMLRLPQISTPIKAEGKTRGQLEEEIYKLYVPNIYKTLTVKVGSEGRTVYVGGEVRIEGRVQYMGRMTVLSAITAAGGFTDFANRKKVQVTRGADGRKVPVNCIKAQRDSKYDVPVFPDDYINVPRRLF